MSNKVGRPEKPAKEKRSERVIAVVKPAVKRAITRARGKRSESSFVAALLEKAVM